MKAGISFAWICLFVIVPGHVFPFRTRLLRGSEGFGLHLFSPSNDAVEIGSVGEPESGIEFVGLGEGERDKRRKSVLVETRSSEEFVGPGVRKNRHARTLTGSRGVTMKGASDSDRDEDNVDTLNTLPPSTFSSVSQCENCNEAEKGGNREGGADCAASNAITKSSAVLLGYDYNNNSKCDSQEKRTAVESSLYSYLSGTQVPSYRFNETINLGFFTPYFHNQLSLGAMRLAIEKINNDPNLLPGRILNFTAVDIGSSDLRGSYTSLPIRIMTEMRDKGMVAFIGGPEDSCEGEALVAASWNLPMISYKCSDHRVSNKSVFYTFARTLPPSSKVSKSVVALFKTFNWDKFVLVVCLNKPDRYQILIDAFTSEVQHYEINITDHYSLPDYIPNRFPEMEKIVEKSYERTRVYVFIGEHLALVHLMKAMDDRQLFDKGDYVIITVDDKLDLKNFFDVAYLNSYLGYWTDGISLKASRSVLKLTPQFPRSKNYSEIERQFANYSTEYPFCIPYHPSIFPDTEVPVEAAYLYDAVMIYARALHELLQINGDPRNGTAIFERIRNRSYHSIQGHDVFIDANGDAGGNYTVVSLLQELREVPHELNESSWKGTMSMQQVGYFQQSADAVDDVPTFRYFDENKQIQWISKEGPPKSEPRCGFRGEKCVYKPDWKTIVICSVFASIVFVVIVLVARYYRYEQKLACLLWKIDMRDVIMIPMGPSEPLNGTKSTVALCRQLLGNAVDGDAPLEFNCKKAYTRIGFYKGMVVAIKPIYKRSIDLTRNIRKELKQIREFRHENIIPFIGASVENGSICILTAYSARGSLEDVLQNEDLHLDNMFLASLVADLIKGMIYLHDSEIICHGNLKSSNCLVDSRWVLQIADFGLHEFKANQERTIGNLKKEQKQLLWRAPELLRDPNAPTRGTQKGDVYSFGIVLFEMIGRSGPWGKTQLSVSEIVKGVKYPHLNPGEAILRPATLHLDCGETILKCLDACWEEDADLRPDFRFIRVRLKEMQAGLKPNIFDNMLSIMEKYACNLEDLVQERTMQLTEEKKKTDALLHRMLPKSVAESLKRGEPVEAESFDSVTIYFSDIVGFTALSADSTPMQVVELLNDLYTCFDSIISHYDVYKVETIGDAYMVVSGLPLRNGDQHAGEVASMALHLLDRIQNFEIRHRPGERLKLRIGIHSGPVVSGVVGLKMPRYCLFGDTVNTASRMESSGDALKIHISDVTKGLLEILGGYHYHERGIIPIKGKGEMCTYWLTGEDPSKTRRNSTESSDTAVVGGDLVITNNNCTPCITVVSGDIPSSAFGAVSGSQTLTLSLSGCVLNAEENSIISSATEEHNNLIVNVKSYKPTTWLLAECNKSKNGSGGVKNIGGKFVSCSNVFQECKANIIKELKRNGTTTTHAQCGTNRFRSAPIITFIETATNTNSRPSFPYEEPNFV